MRPLPLARLTCTLCAALLLPLAACGPTHNHTAFLEVGTPLHLTVTVPSETAATASADVYYRLPSTTAQYQRQALTPRGTQFHTTLPTATLREGESVAYYFDVVSDGKLTALRSPDRPYITTFVSRDELVFRSLRDTVAYKDDFSEVVFKLSSTKTRIDRARVIYSPPDLAGFIVEDMERFGGNWSLTVEPPRVTPGVWSYRLEAEVEGTLYTLPGPDEWETFKVAVAKVPAPALAHLPPKPKPRVMPKYTTEKDLAYRDPADPATDDLMASRCKLDIYYPEHIKDVPTVVFLHAGGLTGGQRFIPGELRRQGIAVVAADYRLSP
ncbi:MAG: hypothetical protein AAGI68_10675, partial [Planctomycetota bacterium]